MVIIGVIQNHTLINKFTCTVTVIKINLKLRPFEANEMLKILFMNKKENYKLIKNMLKRDKHLHYSNYVTNKNNFCEFVMANTHS